MESSSQIPTQCTPPPETRYNCPDAKLILVGTKSDQPTKVSVTKAKHFAVEIGAHGYFMTSAVAVTMPMTVRPGVPGATVCPGVTDLFDAVIRIGVQPKAPPQLTKVRQVRVVGVGPSTADEGKRKKKGVMGALRGSIRGSLRKSKSKQRGSVLVDAPDLRGGAGAGDGGAVSATGGVAPRRAPLRPQASLTSSSVAKMLQAAALSAQAAVR